jgi:hypothetical protein
MDRELKLDELLQQRLSRRDLFRNAGVAGISLSALWDLAWQPAISAAQAPAAPAAPASAPKIGAQLIGKLEGPTTITDPSRFPRTFKEAPQLVELVKAGKLPSVKERIGEDPLVIKPVHEIGRYGGTIRRGFTGPGDWSAGVRFCGNDSLVHSPAVNRHVVRDAAVLSEWLDGRICGREEALGAPCSRRDHWGRLSRSADRGRRRSWLRRLAVRTSHGSGVQNRSACILAEAPPPASV